MANLLDSVENSVWHAFECMALEGDGTVPKSKLKVGHNVIHYFSAMGPFKSQRYPFQCEILYVFEVKRVRTRGVTFLGMPNFAWEGREVAREERGSGCSDLEYGAEGCRL